MRLSIPKTALALVVAAAGTTAALQARQEGGGGQQVWVQRFERQGTRVLVVRGSTPQDFDIVGQFHVVYGTAEWKDEHAEVVKATPPGTRVRLGSDVWTELETNLPLTIGGKDVRPDHYVLLLEKTTDGFALVAVPSQEIRAKRLDASRSDEVEGGIVIPLEMGEDPDAAEDLTIELKKGSADGTLARLELAFGPYTAGADVRAKIDR